MEKIPEEQGKLKYACNESHYFVKSLLPEKYQSPDYDKYQAMIEGTAAGVLAAAGLEGLLELILSKTIDPNLNIAHLLEFGGLTGTLFTIIMPNIIAPYKVKEWIEENPVYSMGVFGVMGGASTYATYDLLKFIFS